MSNILHKIKIIDDQKPSTQAAIELYLSVGWGTPENYDTPLWQAALDGTTRVICAYYEARLIGMARLMSDNNHDSHLTDIVVHPTFQKSGVGQAIIRRIIDLYGHTSIYIDGLNKNNNQAFFERCGFIVRTNMFVASRPAQRK